LRGIGVWAWHAKWKRFQVVVWSGFWDRSRKFSDAQSDQMISAMRQAYEEMLEERKKASSNAANTTSDVIPEIIMFTRSSCVECKRWLGSEAERFRRLGWRIVTSEDKDFHYRFVPHFIVTDCARSVEVSGYMTVERLAEVLR
jgi:hypothetical protein